MADEFYDIKILKDGTWLYGGTPIGRLNMVKLFASVLRKDLNGDYWLETPYEKGRITVEDAPFTAVEMKVESSGKNQALSFRTNVDQWVTAGPGHDIRVETDPATGEPSPYIHVRDGLEARIARAVYYDMVKLAAAADPAAYSSADPAAYKKGVYGVWSKGVFYRVGEMP